MKIITKVLVAAFLLVSTTGFCHDDIECALPLSIREQTVEGKYYVTPGTVYVAPEGIFLYVEGELIRVLALYSDSTGVYVNSSEILIGKGYWMCKRCTAYNPDSREKCRNGCNDFDLPP